VKKQIGASPLPLFLMAELGGFSNSEVAKTSAVSHVGKSSGLHCRSASAFRPRVSAHLGLRFGPVARPPSLTSTPVATLCLCCQFASSGRSSIGWRTRRAPWSSDSISRLISRELPRACPRAVSASMVGFRCGWIRRSTHASDGGQTTTALSYRSSISTASAH